MNELGNINIIGMDREAIGEFCKECEKKIELYPASIEFIRADGEKLKIFCHKQCSLIYSQKFIKKLKNMLSQCGIKDLKVDVTDFGYN